MFTIDVVEAGFQLLNIDLSTIPLQRSLLELLLQITLRFHTIILSIIWYCNSSLPTYTFILRSSSMLSRLLASRSCLDFCASLWRRSLSSSLRFNWPFKVSTSTSKSLPRNSKRRFSCSSCSIWAKYFLWLSSRSLLNCWVFYLYILHSFSNLLASVSNFWAKVDTLVYFYIIYHHIYY